MAAKILARTEHLVLRHLTNDKSQIRHGAPEVRTRRDSNAQPSDPWQC
jgi:hypothetical protein